MSRHPGTVYQIRVRHPRTGRLVRNGYIGKTRRKVEIRISEHLHGSTRFGSRPQPWAADVVGWKVLWHRDDCSAMRLWWAEVWRILVRFPLHNDQWNRRNPRRIPIYESRRRAGWSS